MVVNITLYWHLETSDPCYSNHCILIPVKLFMEVFHNHTTKVPTRYDRNLILTQLSDRKILNSAIQHYKYTMCTTIISTWSFTWTLLVLRQSSFLILSHCSWSQYTMKLRESWYSSAVILPFFLTYVIYLWCSNSSGPAKGGDLINFYNQLHLEINSLILSPPNLYRETDTNVEQSWIVEQSSSRFKNQSSF